MSEDFMIPEDIIILESPKTIVPGTNNPPQRLMQQIDDDEYINNLVKIRVSETSKAHAAQLLQELVDKILQGWTRSQMIGFCMKQFSIGFEVAIKFIDRAFDLNTENLTDEFIRQLDLAKSRRLYLYKQAVATLDFPTALKCLQDLSRLNNEYNTNSNANAIKTLERLINRIDTAAETIDAEVVEDDDLEIDNPDEDITEEPTN